MAEIDDNWSADANEAMRLSFVAPTTNGVTTLFSPFNPKFTYPIFGEEQRIFGYQNLRIDLRFNASDMRPHVAIAYTKKFQPMGDTEAANIPELLEDFLPPVAFQKSKDWEAAIRTAPESWTPPGEKIGSFQSKKSNMEIWKGNLGDPAVKQLVARMQILVPLFIEAGQPIDVDQPEAHRWTVFFLYDKSVDAITNKETYKFAGYCTTYTFYPFLPLTPPASPGANGNDQPAVKDDLELGDGNFDLSQLPCRTRISQFIITPPFQKMGNGSRFYIELYQHYLKHPQTVELTVEDPNEDFDDMRDLCDLTYLRTRPDFQNLKLNTGLELPKDGVVPKNIVDPTAYEKIRREVKIAPRQFARVLEMHLMSKLPESVRVGIAPEGDGKAKAKAAKPGKEVVREYNLWRLLVKSRLYRQNKDVLGELDVAERLEKLDEVTKSVEFEYARLLMLLEFRTKGKGKDNGNGKRKADESVEGEASASKKARVEDA